MIQLYFSELAICQSFNFTFEVNFQKIKIDISSLNFDTNIWCFRCIKGLLKNKIVILVTHQVKFLEHADDIVCLNEVS